MKEPLTLYHGSPQIVTQPTLSKGKPHNDYGTGFYCTESIALAKEWACSNESDGFANEYTLQQKDLSILNLSCGAYHILHWLSILLENRTFRLHSPVAINAHAYILEHFMVDYQAYDVIRGYRADDSYFSFATAFLNNTISLGQLERAMFLGNLGEQVVLRTEKAFASFTFVDSFPAEKNIYLPKKLERDTQAREGFHQEKEAPIAETELYMIDILRERWQKDDPRLQRILLR